ncbi:hypothetical protein GPY51_21755 [Photorhabdus laumondii subsp. laumondii]|uniref:Uncharacterized protein n=2 Tax=Photorhabdus laumondii TaxID=2218628 RepID=A0A6L9JT36_PHOLM|nr:hypothetical protein [Photorhabdus laumondii]PQQ36768.1 hypothetical protein C6H68_17025 [Photorhabdus luminescens]MCZ1248679.1 hypothetical protein [Photorhabdus laumondii subsp. laumondii]NDL23122.1 hypothetical protein [Photorhabdus laumondii subsp. laumondii]NDL32099.1 hypothetical protein [Photorhabdus laumondii subsp. laumondii]NDL36707.1 hypothetical protein [Photorhabdus laumondii subsp. laumondii]
MMILQELLTFLDPVEGSVVPVISVLRKSNTAAGVLTEDNSAITVRICHDVGLEFKVILAF